MPRGFGIWDLDLGFGIWISSFNRSNPASNDTLERVSIEAGFCRLKLELPDPRVWDLGFGTKML